LKAGRTCCVAYEHNASAKSSINTTFTQDGKVITTNTIYNADNGQPIAQRISIRNSQGKVTTQNMLRR
jgi:hypothetical protein